MDWRNPDYTAIFRERMRRLKWLREDPDKRLPPIKAFYKDHIADFISDWGVTFDPRNAERGLPTVIPFVLFQKQREWVDWLIERWRAQRPGATEKSRDMGISWLAMATSCSLGLHYEGLAIGFGSRKEDLVDKIGTYKALLPKARMFLEHLPEEFRGGWRSWCDAPFMRINFPQTGSLIMGEAGDQLGRGDRASIYFVDEAEYIERAELVEHSLSQTTNCRIDLSSVNGSNNPVAKKIASGKVNTFIFDWRDDPRKDQAWYDKQCQDLDPVTVAQEIDRDRSASVTGIVIPGAWIRSCIDALKVLGLPPPSGLRGMSLDVADEGTDYNALIGTHGVEVNHLEEWSGKGADIFATTERAFAVCDEHGIEDLRYDADGLGAGVRGDGRVINQRRRAAGNNAILLRPFRGSDAVHDPDGLVYAGDKGRVGARTNKDYFANHKAQGWWALRTRAQKTHRWVTAKREGKEQEGICNPDEILSLDPKMPLLQKLVTELSQPTYSINQVGKMVINKKPDATKSPNLADGVMQRYAPSTGQALNITPELLAKVRGGMMFPRRGRR